MPDWNDYLNRAGRVLRATGTMAKAYAHHSEIVGMLSADLETGKALIARLVRALPPAELADFEARFLQYSSLTVYDPAHKRRAMELYAHLKVLQAARGGSVIDITQRS